MNNKSTVNGGNVKWDFQANNGLKKDYKTKSIYISVNPKKDEKKDIKDINSKNNEKKNIKYSVENSNKQKRHNIVESSKKTSELSEKKSIKVPNTQLKKIETE